MDPGNDARWKLWAEVFRLWLPVCISLCAISLTVFQAMATRRHSRLSVQPRVDWRISEEAAAGTLAISLVNVGFGPAIIRDPTLVVDGQLFPLTGLDACQAAAERIGRGGGDDWDTSCFASKDEHVLRAGDSEVIFGSRPTAAHAAEDHGAALVDYRRFSVTATYCSFYEDCWQLGTD